MSGRARYVFHRRRRGKRITSGASKRRGVRGISGGLPFFWGTLVALGALMYAALMKGLSTLGPGLLEDSGDLKIYWQTGEEVLNGSLPYRDFFIEYPPGSIPAFILPALFSDGRLAYIDLFAQEMAVALAVTLVLVALAARRVFGEGRWLLPSITFALGAALLYPVAVTRYDAVVALTLAVAALCAALGGRYLYAACASLGLGAAVKLVPLLAFAPLVLSRVARGRRVRGTAVFALVVALFFVPALVFAGDRFAGSFAYHAERGLQVESLWSSVLMFFGGVRSVSFEYGAFEVHGPLADLGGALSFPLTAALLLITGLAMWRYEGSGGSRGLPKERFPRYAAALVLAFMLGSKVLSPQYVIWLLPLVPLAAGGVRGALLCALLVVTCWMTTLVFPNNYPALLEGRSPGPELLLGRNLLLLGTWVLLLLPQSANSLDANSLDAKSADAKSADAGSGAT